MAFQTSDICRFTDRGLRMLGLAFLVYASGCRSAASIQRWEAQKQEGGDPPQIRFSFDKPHDAYQGVASISHGVLHLGPRGTFEKATGRFEVSIDSISLGEAELDESVRYGAVLLQGRKYPHIRFTIREIRAGVRHLNEVQDVVLVGDFELKGGSVPLNVSARLERQQSKEGVVRLLLSGEFNLEQLQERFGITGPGAEGDAAGNFVRITFHVYLSQAAHSHEWR